MLEAKGLRKAYGDRTAVADVSFSIPQGSFYGLLGPNGAGKTTTISMVVGVLTPDAGEVWFDGKPVRPGDPSFRSRIGYVPQEIALYEELSAEANLSFFGALYGLQGKRLADRTDAVLEIANLRDRAKEPVTRFSGGMKRRLNIAAALLHDPDLVVLDEPTVGVDPQSRNAIFDALEALKTVGKTLIYTTHYMEEVERLCDRLAIVDQGRVVQEGSLRELLRSETDHRRIEICLTDVPTEMQLSAIRESGCLTSMRWEPPFLIGETDRLEYAVRILPDLISAMELGFDSVNTDRTTLESVFLRLTGRSLRD